MMSTTTALAATGPFSGDWQGRIAFRRQSAGRSRGAVLTSEADGRIVCCLRHLKVLSRHQLAALASLGQERAKRSCARLFRLGFLDRLVTDRTPPLYVLGPTALHLLNQPDETWDVLRAFRLAAANQLWLGLRGWADTYHVEPHLGLTASFTRGGKRFGVLCPRLWPGDIDWCRDLAALADDKLVIVAGDGRQAAELARLLPVEFPVRFTWDALLADGRPVFYRRRGRKLEPAEEVDPGDNRPKDDKEKEEEGEEERESEKNILTRPPGPW